MSKTNHSITVETLTDAERQRLAEETRSNIDGDGERVDPDGGGE
jgi:hypothetical protein